MGGWNGIRAWARNLSLRSKLVALLLTVTFVALAAGFGINVYSNIRLFKAETASAADNLTTVLAEFAVAPLEFGDDRGAHEVLARLGTTPSVMAVAIYDADGQLFAAFIQPGSRTNLPEQAKAITAGFAAGRFDALREINYRGRPYGTVFTRLSTADLDTKIEGYVAQVALIFLGVLALCALLAYRLQRVISVPIIRLAEAAHQVSNQEDYSVRVEAGGQDEIGRLYEAFNVMLSRIETRQQERDAAAARLRKSETQYRAVVQDQIDLVFRIRPEGTLIFVNEAYARFCGRRFEELVGISHFDLVHPDDREAVRSHLQTLTPGHPVDRFEYRVMSGAEQVRWLDTTYRAILGDSGVVVEMQGVGRDVTELKRAEAEKAALARQLEHSQRLETIGTLAGGIAHDFNNLLTPIMGCMELARLDLDEDSDAAEQLRVALASSQRAKELVQQILTFSRRSDLDHAVVQLETVVRETVQLLGASLPADVEVRTDIATGGSAVRANSSQLHQMVVNLCTNACQAMAETGGVLELVLDTEVVPERSTGPVGGPAPGRYVRLAVRDTGPGMSEDLQQRIFEPFFTTKPAGRGTGLGLSVVHGIVTAHAGHISVTSRPGEGTTFTVRLPESRDAVPDDAGPAAGVQGRGGRLLLVDDEVDIVELGARMLIHHGHEVVTATDPEQALAIYRQDPAGFDLVITDQTMPGMTGIDLARKIAELSPGVRVILTSGLDLGGPEHALPAGVTLVARLQKPFSLDEIGRVVLQGLQIENP